MGDNSYLLTSLVHGIRLSLPSNFPVRLTLFWLLKPLSFTHTLSLLYLLLPSFELSTSFKTFAPHLAPSTHAFVNTSMLLWLVYKELSTIGSKKGKKRKCLQTWKGRLHCLFTNIRPAKSLSKLIIYKVLFFLRLIYNIHNVFTWIQNNSCPTKLCISDSKLKYKTQCNGSIPTFLL